jgi:hypothetical protein
MSQVNKFVKKAYTYDYSVFRKKHNSVEELTTHKLLKEVVIMFTT